MSQVTLQQALQLGLQHHQAGRLPEAEAIYRQVLAVAPDNADASHLLGIIAHQVGQHAAALQLISQAIQLSPFTAAYYNSLGESYRALGQLEPAVAAYQACLARNPRSPEALNNMALTFDWMGKPAESEPLFRKALEIAPEFADAWNNLGTVLSKLGRHEEAIAAHQQALAVNPHYAAAHNNLGVAYEKAGRLEEAIEAYRQATVENPQLAESFHNMGVPLIKFNRVAEALAAWDRAIELRPEYPDPHFNRALAWLLNGDLERGWAEHEWRWKVPALQAPRAFTQPQWDGGDLQGKTLLVHCEQGYGDSVQFVRLLPLLAGRGARIILEAQAELVELFRGMPGVDVLLATNDPLPAFDLQIPLLSLPLPLKITLANLPARVPYLQAPAARVGAWKERVEKALGAAGPGVRPLRVGLAWAGRPSHHDDQNRSMRLADLAGLANVPHVVFYSLQKGPASEQLAGAPAGMRVIDLATGFADFSDTAAAIAQLDLVIGVDTSVVHVAGALGKPVWTLLPFAPDWRWLLERSDTPWYPTMRLYRQAARRDWSGAVEAVVRDLARLAGEARG